MNVKTSELFDNIRERMSYYDYINLISKYESLKDEIEWGYILFRTMDKYLSRYADVLINDNIPINYDIQYGINQWSLVKLLIAEIVDNSRPSIILKKAIMNNVSDYMLEETRKSLHDKRYRDVFYELLSLRENK
jgi:hypothetical protein